jgi:hypothetical protein
MLRTIFTALIIWCVAIISLVSTRAAESELSQLTSLLKPREILQIEQSVDKVISRNQSSLTSERIQTIITKIDTIKMVSRLTPKGRYILEYLKYTLTALLDPITITPPKGEISVNMTSIVQTWTSNIPVSIRTFSYIRGNKTLLAGIESNAVAKFELSALYEDITIKDFSISSSNNLDERIESIQIYNASGIVIAKGAPQGNKVIFNNHDILVKQWGNNRYMTITPRMVGYNQATHNGSTFTLNLTITRAEGKTSTEQVQVNLGNQQSDSISIRPFVFKKAELTPNRNGNTTDSILSNWTTKIAVFALGIDAGSNTSSNNGSIKVIPYELRLQLWNNIAGAINSISLRNINGSSSINCIIAGSVLTCPMMQLPVWERIVESGSEQGFVLTLNAILSTNSTESISLMLENGGLSYTTNEDNTLYTDLGLGNGYSSSVSKRE